MDDTDGPTIHEHFDKEAGRITLVCEDVATFERLRAAVYREAGRASTIHVFPAPVRAVCVELADDVESVPPTVHERVAAWGCVAALGVSGLIFLIGLLATVAWLVR